jgi:Ca2+-binding EF-hand superfamily protein
VPAERDEVQANINKFVRGEIDTNSFESCLKRHKINPSTVEISKVIRSGLGGPVSYTELAGAVNRYRDSYNK